MRLPTNLDPATFVVDRAPGAEIDRLYEEYGEELAEVCDVMTGQRATMRAAGYSADLSDREAEILYLLVRSRRPSVVVEVSPCHGYSTNYLLAALARNGEGHLHSYEICTDVRGRPIEEVVRGNLAPIADGERLTLHVGDATTASIPDADLLFLDSGHEAEFAAWYGSELLPRSALTIVHDIVTVDGSDVMPKGGSLGVREQYVLLELLARCGVGCFSVALWDRVSTRPVLARRHEASGSDRSIVIPRLALTPEARELLDGMTKVSQLRAVAVTERETVLEGVHELVTGGASPFVTATAAILLADLGYRAPAHQETLPPVRPRGTTTAPTLGAALEAATRTRRVRDIGVWVRAARNSGVDDSFVRRVADLHREMNQQRRLSRSFRWVSRGVRRRLLRAS